MKQFSMDVVLFGGETAEQVAARLTERFDVQVSVDAEQACPGGVSLTAVGSERGIRQVKGWYANDGKERPDLRGVAPVGKGQRRATASGGS